MLNFIPNFSQQISMKFIGLEVYLPKCLKFVHEFECTSKL